MKEEGTKHLLILYNVRLDMAGGVDFSAANAKSNAQLRVKGESGDMMASSTVILRTHLLLSCVSESAANKQSLC